MTNTSEAPADSAAVRTFLIADIRGYTRFTDSHGDEATSGLAKKFAAVMAEGIEAWGGRLVELRGDEALAVFTSARAALRAAVELQDAFADETVAEPDLPLAVGVGLDAGEAVSVGDGFPGRRAERCRQAVCRRGRRRDPRDREPHAFGRFDARPEVRAPGADNPEGHRRNRHAVAGWHRRAARRFAEPAPRRAEGPGTSAARVGVPYPDCGSRSRPALARVALASGSPWPFAHRRHRGTDRHRQDTTRRRDGQAGVAGRVRGPVRGGWRSDPVHLARRASLDSSAASGDRRSR